MEFYLAFFIAFIVAREFLIRAKFIFPWAKRKRIVVPNSVLVEKIKYDSAGLKITGVLCRPKKKGNHPVIVFCHGYYGPTEWARHNYAWENKADELAWWASRGFVAVASNYRGTDGSDGNVEGGEGELEDVLNALRHLKGKPYADSKNVFLVGKSMGGAIALHAATKIPAVRAVCAYYAPYDFHFLGQRFHIVHAIFSLFTIGPLGLSSGGLDRISPKTFASKIRCPVLLLHGKGDEIVSWESAGKIAGEIGKKAKVMLFENEGHGFSAQAAQMARMEALALFRKVLKKPQ